MDWIVVEVLVGFLIGVYVLLCTRRFCLDIVEGRILVRSRYVECVGVRACMCMCVCGRYVNLFFVILMR